MPVGCPNCGTQNPDGSLFCQNCRTPLTAGPVAPPPMAPRPPQAPPPAYGAPPPAYGAPPPAYGPPPPAYGAPPPAYAAPGGYAPAYGAPAPSPYYTPAGAPPPVHRTPTGLIIGGGIGVFLLLAILAIAGAFIFGNKSSSGNHVSSLPPPTAAPTVAPVSTPTPSAAPSATPGTTRPTPTPTASATAAPTAKPVPAAGAIETNTFTMGLAPGFRKLKSDTVSAAVANDTGNIYVAAGKQDHESSVDSEFTGLVDNLKQKYSQVGQCTKAAPISVGGVNGILWGFNYLFTPQGGQAVKVCDLYFIAVPDSDKTLFYQVELFMADADFDKFANGSAVPQVEMIHWKLP